MESERFPNLIRRARERRGIRSVELAARLGKAQSFVSRLETGKVMETPGPDVLAALARELDISVAEMLDALGYDVGVPEMPSELPDSLTAEQRDEVLRYARYLAESHQSA